MEMLTAFYNCLILFILISLLLLEKQQLFQILRNLCDKALRKVQFHTHSILSPAEYNTNIDSEETFRTAPGNHSAPLVRKVRHFPSTECTVHLAN